MSDSFMQHDGVEAGYFAKRKDQFNNEIAKGLKASTSQPTSVRSKPRHNTAKTPSAKPAPVKAKPAAKKSLIDTPPNQLSGKDFAERMRLAREAKANEK